MRYSDSEQMRYTASEEGNVTAQLQPDGQKVIWQVGGERATAREILDFLPDLNANGFHQVKGRTGLLDLDVAGTPSHANAAQLAGWLTSFDETRVWNKWQDSYGLKHTFERETGTYMPNGAFIVGVIQAGFTIRTTSGLNAQMKLMRAAL
jgi:hypothetical protein